MKKKRRKRKGRKEKEEEKEQVKLRNFQKKRKSMVMINLYKAKLMNEENWVDIETTGMRKNVKV